MFVAARFNTPADGDENRMYFNEFWFALENQGLTATYPPGEHFIVKPPNGVIIQDDDGVISDGTWILED